MKLSLKEKLSFGLGAVGKDMVYMLSATYVLYYYQDLLGVNGVIMGMIMMAARVFDAFNDPFMGVLVAKTRTRFGKFRPWLFIGTLTDAIILFMLFAAPPALEGNGLVVYAAVIYILWGVTYTLMDIPFWSMIPAFTEAGKERENMSAFARSCAGVGSAVISVITVLSVSALGKMRLGEDADARLIEIEGFKLFALIIAVVFFIFILITCICIKEKSNVEMKSPSVGEMFKALFKNDQALVIVATIVLINTALYTTSNLIIYFFKYDFGGEGWKDSYTLFTTYGGAVQILAMMILFPVLRKKLNTEKLFYTSFYMSIVGYATLLVLMFTSIKSVYILFIPATLIFGSVGLQNVLTTIFLANSCDYGELKNGRRDESVIFSMQTFVVKLASGVAVFVAGVALDIFNISDNTEDVVSSVASSSGLIGLRMIMTILPILGLIIAIIVFKKRFILTDAKLSEINAQLKNNQ